MIKKTFFILILFSFGLNQTAELGNAKLVMFMNGLDPDNYSDKKEFQLLQCEAQAMEQALSKDPDFDITSTLLDYDIRKINLLKDIARGNGFRNLYDALLIQIKILQEPENNDLYVTIRFAEEKPDVEELICSGKVKKSGFFNRKKVRFDV